ESADFLGLIGIGNVVGTQATVEERADDDLIGLPGGRHRRVFMNVVCAETAAAAGIGIDRRQRAGGDGDEVLLVARVDDPYQLRPVLSVVFGRLVGDNEQAAVEQRYRRVH